ncbi:hypothetical protein [Flavobacterium sp. HNIBRBA15423]|uniref:hypothetical protein n=1 Tax=Flavobacterium sp. HNIBRBA15423 TaxID=3458683 RepID=UPI0040448EB7
MRTAKMTLCLFLICMGFTIQAQQLKNGTYYRTASDGTIEIFNCCDNEKLTVTFKNTDGTENTRDMKAVQGTDGLYLFVGDGYFYFIAENDEYLERYIFNGNFNYATADPADYYEILSQDQSLVNSKKSSAELRRKMLESGKEKFYFPRLLTKYAKAPANERFQIDKYYKGISSLGQKSTMHVKVIDKNTIDVVFGAKVKMLTLKGRMDTQTFYRHHLNPNIFMNYDTPTYWGRSDPDEYIYFGADGIHYIYNEGNKSIFLFGDEKKKYNEQEIMEMEFKAKDDIEKKFRKQKEIFMNSWIDNPKMPATAMVDDEIKTEALKALQKHAKDKGWKEKFNEVVITSGSWSDVITASYIGRIVEVAAKATWSDGHCTFQYFDMISMYENGNYSKTLYHYTTGNQYETNCQ